MDSNISVWVMILHPTFSVLRLKLSDRLLKIKGVLTRNLSDRKVTICSPNSAVKNYQTLFHADKNQLAGVKLDF